MLNQIVLVVRLTSDLEIQKTESGKRRTLLTLAVPRSFKNVYGGYDQFKDITLSLRTKKEYGVYYKDFFIEDPDYKYVDNGINMTPEEFDF